MHDILRRTISIWILPFPESQLVQLGLVLALPVLRQKGMDEGF